MATIPPPPINVPVIDPRTGLMSREWVIYNREVYVRIGGAVAPTSAEEHIADTSGAHAASAISSNTSGNLTSTNVQAALQELQNDVDTRATTAALATLGSNLTDAITAATDGLTDAINNETDAREFLFDTTTGHRHDGADSPKVLATDLDPAGASSGQVLKFDGANVVWVAGGGAGGGGVNFLGLDSTWTLTTSDDRDCEGSIGSVAAYADAAATTPVDMTGGTPGSTLSRITSNHLNGAASWKFDLGSGSSRQGEGFAWPTVYVPEGYRGKNVAFTGVWSATGALVEDDLRLVAYDVTNNEPISVTSYSKIVGSSGTWLGILATKTTTAQIRVGVHVARTSTAALALTFDDVSVGPAIPAVGMSGSDWQSYTPIFNGLGTVTSIDFWWRQVGDSWEILGTGVTGVPTASELRVGLPTGGTIDPTKVATTRPTGRFVRNANVAHNEFAALAVGGVSYLTCGTLSGGTATGSVPTTSHLGNSICASTERFFVHAMVPVVGRSSNVQLGESAVKRISHYLANGTRVTGSAPTKLGEYRSYLRQAGAFTYTETNGSPTTAPTVTDGIKLWTGLTHAAGDTANQPSKYEIFVGKGKNVRFDFFASAGRTGFYNPMTFTTGSADIGTQTYYDPTTGIATVQVFDIGSTNVRIGGDGASGSLSSGYFDIVVAENPLFVSAEAPVYARYTNGSTSIGTSDTTVVYSSKVEDSHGIYNSSTGVISIPYTKKYTIAGRIESNGSMGSATSCKLNVYVNGSRTDMAISFVPSGFGAACQGAITLPLNAGDQVTLRASYGTAGAMYNNSAACWFTIVSES